MDGHPFTASWDEEEEESIVPAREPPSPPTSSLTTSSSPESSPSSSLSSSESTARPVTPPDVEDRMLHDINDKLGILEDGQKMARELLERLGDQEFPMPEDHTGELVDCQQ